VFHFLFFQIGLLHHIGGPPEGCQLFFVAGVLAVLAGLSLKTLEERQKTIR